MKSSGKETLASLAIVLSTQSSDAQDLGSAVAGELATGALKQGGDLLRQAPEQLDGLLSDAAGGHQFETEQSCLAHLQLAAQFAALAGNTMPFSEAWTLEDERGPVVKLRVMLGGDRTHVELHCSDTTLRADILPWGEGPSQQSRIQMSTLDAALGALFVMNSEGAFEGDQELASAGEDMPPSFGGAAPHTQHDVLPPGKRPAQTESAEVERRLDSIAEEIVDLEREAAAVEQQRADIERILADIDIQGAKYYWSYASLISEPTIEFTIRNETEFPIRRLFARGIVSSPGRTLPWIDETFNYAFPGGLEPSEERHLRLAPNAFSDWGNRDLADRDDLILTVVATGIEDAEGKLVENEDEDRVPELRQELAKLIAQREVLLRSTGRAAEEEFPAAPDGAATNDGE